VSLDDSGMIGDLSEHPDEVRPRMSTRSIGGVKAEHAPAPLKATSLVQWSMLDDRTYLPVGATSARLQPGVYEIIDTNAGIVFQRVEVKTEGLVHFPQANSELVVRDIRKFWEREHRFREFDLTYKRGILLWGPPGSGKSCTIQLLCADVVARGGVVVKFTNPYLFSQGMRRMREIEPQTPVIALMEDVDSLLENNSETDVLNILDGIDRIDRIVFLASTNYPERLGGRIANRPSRFDKRVHIGLPNEESRRIYLQFILKGKSGYAVDVERWVADTKGFSIAHLKELFVSVVIQEDGYDETLATLRSMGKSVSSTDGDTKPGIGR
jgi:hypothetical protein